MGVETDLGASLQSLLQEVVTLLAVVVHMDLTLAGVGCLLLEDADDDVQGTVLPDDSEGSLENPRVLLGQVPECGIEEGFAVVDDDDGVHILCIGNEPLGPCFRHEWQSQKDEIKCCRGTPGIVVMFIRYRSTRS